MVLGDHVKQAGSRVSDASLRFDFNHHSSVTDEQLQDIESLVNQAIQDNFEVVTQTMPLKEAIKSGAKALFGEKYGERVRVVQIGPQSKELCGGTHIERSGDIGTISILQEGSVAAGVRRLEVLSAKAANAQIAKQQGVLKSLGRLLQSGEQDLLSRVQRMLEKNKELESLATLARASQQSNAAGELAKSAQELSDGIKVIASEVTEMSPKQLRELADDLKARLNSACILLASKQNGKILLLSAVTKDLVHKYHAGDMMKEVSKIVGARGGGKADLAQAGGGDPARTREALERFQELLYE